MMRYVIAFTLAIFSGSALADRLTSDAVICLSEQAMDQMIQAALRNDERGVLYQFEKKACLRIGDRPQVSVLERGMNSKAYIRIYAMDMQAWTVIDYVE